MDRQPGFAAGAGDRPRLQCWPLIRSAAMLFGPYQDLRDRKRRQGEMIADASVACENFCQRIAARQSAKPFNEGGRDTQPCFVGGFQYSSGFDHGPSTVPGMEGVRPF